MASTKKPYRAYRTITRVAAYARGFDGMWIETSEEADIARDMLFNRDNDYHTVDFCLPLHNERTARYTPAPGVIVHLKRPHRKAIVRIGQ